jgi:hypothetical protein
MMLELGEIDRHFDKIEEQEVRKDSEQNRSLPLERFCGPVPLKGRSCPSSAFNHELEDGF